MLRKFLFMLSLLCAFTAGTNSVMAADQTFGTGNNTVTLKTSSDGKTLTISGKGDLTALDANYTFKSNSGIYKSTDGTNYSAVNDNDAYSASNKYATRQTNYSYEAIDKTTFENTYVAPNTYYYFTEAGASKYYTQSTDWSTGSEVVTYTKVTANSKVDTNGEWVEGATVSKYFTLRAGTTDEYERVSDVSTITSSETDVTSETKKQLQNASDIFTKSGESYTQVNSGADYSGETTYYKRTTSYTYNNVDLAYLLYNFLVKNSSDLVNALRTAASATGVTEVVFENTDTESPLYIDNSIFQAVLFSEDEWGNFTSHSGLETVDYGAATVKGYLTVSDNTNSRNAGWSGLKLKTLTIPLVEADAKGNVTVPTTLFHYYAGDVATVVSNSYSGTIDGVYQTVGMPSTINIPAGYTAVGDSAFYNMTGVNVVTIGSGVRTLNESAFQGCSKLKTVSFPTTLETISARAFASCTDLTDVTFPEALRTIGDQAFVNCKSYYTVVLNEGLETIGNSAFYSNSTLTTSQEVLTVPASVKYMGPASFGNRRYKDVYFYGDKAPLSPLAYPLYDGATYSTPALMAAFDDAMLMGNNGFNPSKYDKDSEGNNVETTRGDAQNGYANRENYTNGGTYIAVLHFRSDIKDDPAETFTDITRNYITWRGEDGSFGYGASKSIGSETGTLSFGTWSNGSGNNVAPGYEDTSVGSQIIWPSQNQWVRSYVCNSNSLKWDGVTTYAPTLTEDEIKLIKKMEPTYFESKSDQDISKVAYIGTRQFVLVSRDVNGKKQDEYPVPVDQGERWWTLCVPCDVTKGEVDKVFGQNTHLCLFSKVVRKVDETNGNEIHLYFQQDTYKNKYTRNADGTWTKGDAVSSDNDIVLYAHTPYMVYPASRKDDGKQYILENYTLQSGDALPTVLVSVNSADATDADDNSVKYMFTSNYRGKVSADDDTETKKVASKVQKVQKNVTIPQYSYVFGRTTDDKSGKESKFFFYTGTSKQWSTNKCIVERYDSQGSLDENDFFAKLNNGAKANSSIFGEDNGSTTGVDKVVYHMGEDSDAPVYNLNGQMVSRDGSLSGLASGIYVQGGKKFIVK